MPWTSRGSLSELKARQVREQRKSGSGSVAKQAQSEGKAMKWLSELKAK